MRPRGSETQRLIPLRGRTRPAMWGRRVSVHAEFSCTATHMIGEFYEHVIQKSCSVEGGKERLRVSTVQRMIVRESGYNRCKSLD